MELEMGQLVYSRKGRDVTGLYAVVGFLGGRVLLANGKERGLQNPKHKNPRHLQPVAVRLKPEETETDLSLKTALKAYLASRGPKQQGG